MAEQDNIKTARDSIAAFSAKDWARMKTLLTATSVYDEKATQRRVQGADEIIQLNQGWTQAFPDAKGTVTNALASGDTVVLEITWEGTQSGALASPSGPIPPSGKRVAVQAVQVLTLAAGKISDTRHYFDLMGLLQQIGAVPAAG